MLPARCYSCGKVLAHLENEWNRLLNTMDAGEALDQLGIKKICCRKCMLCSFQKMEMLIDYERSNELFLERDTSHHYVTVHTVNNDPERKTRIIEGR